MHVSRPPEQPFSSHLKPGFHLLFGLVLFVFSYFWLNWNLIAADVWTPWSAGNATDASNNASYFLLQATILLSLLAMAPRAPVLLLLTTVSISVLVNGTYESLLHAPLDSSALAWLWGERHRALEAVNEYPKGFATAMLKTMCVIALLAFASVLMQSFAAKIATRWRFLWVAMLLAYVAMDPWLVLMGGYRRGTEANVFAQVISVLSNSKPARQSVDAVPSSDRAIEKIVWLIDESISWKHFERYIVPGIPSTFGAIDFGDTSSMGNCSQQSNSLLRWGVDVEKLNQHTDLRSTPTIWAYAKRAGYTTTLIDGQTMAFQNNMWPPERELIDTFNPLQDGISTDKAIAREVHNVLQSENKQFVYVVLRGAHFPYENNYPASEKIETDSKEERYRKALEFSKIGFFKEMLGGLDLSNTVIFYTSDHGQILKDDSVTHCNSAPIDEEYSVPLLGIFPPSLRSNYHPVPGAKLLHSHSQIFPTTLQFMGYSQEYAQQNYDKPLPFATKRLTRFGRNIFPLEGDAAMDFKFDQR